MPEQPRSILAKVREDLAKLPAAQRASTDALLVEHLAALADVDLTVPVIKELRTALHALVGDEAPALDTVDELQRRRRDRAARPNRSAVHHDRR